MQFANHRRATTTAVAAILLTVASAGIVYQRRSAQLAKIRAHYRSVASIPAGAPSIPFSELDRLLAGDFTVVRDFRQIPPPVLISFVNLVGPEGTKPPMVNPGEEMSTDLILPGVPSRRLRFAATNDTSAIIVYEQGGFVGTLRVTVFDFTGARAFATVLNENVRDLQILRKALSNR